MSNSSNAITSVKCRIASVFLRDDGILQIDVASEQVFGLDDMKELIEAAEKIGQGKKFRNLIRVGTNTMPTPDAIEYSASEEGSVYKIADAFVINSVGQKLIGNFVLKVQKQTVPTRYFTKQDDAEEWLRKQPDR